MAHGQAPPYILRVPRVGCAHRCRFSRDSRMLLPPLAVRVSCIGGGEGGRCLYSAASGWMQVTGGPAPVTTHMGWPSSMRRCRTNAEETTDWTTGLLENRRKSPPALDAAWRNGNTTLYPHRVGSGVTVRRELMGGREACDDWRDRFSLRLGYGYLQIITEHRAPSTERAISREPYQHALRWYIIE